MNTIESIKSIIYQQLDAYRILLDVLRKERECLINLSIDGIEAVTKEKDTVALRIKLLDEERIRLISKFTAEFNIEGDITLQKITEITGDNSFSDLRLKFISILQSISEINEFNRILIDRSMQYIKNSANILSTFGYCFNPNQKSPFYKEV